MTVAETILAQLGGRRFLVMTGAKNLLAGDSSLNFDLPGGSAKNKATKVRVTLTARDDYTVEFYSWNARALDLKALAKVDGIYCDNLREVFTDATGLRCTL